MLVSSWFLTYKLWDMSQLYLDTLIPLTVALVNPE